MKNFYKKAALFITDFFLKKLGIFLVFFAVSAKNEFSKYSQRNNLDKSFSCLESGLDEYSVFLIERIKKIVKKLPLIPLAFRCSEKEKNNLISLKREVNFIKQTEKCPFSYRGYLLPFKDFNVMDIFLIRFNIDEIIGLEQKWKKSPPPPVCFCCR